MSFLGISKNRSYESPCIAVIGTQWVETGLEGKTKDICKAKVIGTWKAGNVELWYLFTKRWIGK